MELEIVGMALVPYDSNTGVVSNSGESLRSPTEKEVLEHIGLTTNVTVKDTRFYDAVKSSKKLDDTSEGYLKEAIS